MARDKLRINTTAKSILLKDNTTTISTTTGDIGLTNGVEIKVMLIDVLSAKEDIGYEDQERRIIIYFWDTGFLNPSA